MNEMRGTKSEMLELARQMERGLGFDKLGHPKAITVEDGTREWNIIIDALRCAAEQA